MFDRNVLYNSKNDILTDIYNKNNS
jgi:hypothetical protein